MYVPQSELNQRFFEEFCKKLKQIKEQNKDISENIISDLKERWSTFICKNNINLFMNDSIHPDVAGQLYRIYERIATKNFKALMKEINIDDIKNYNFYNPFNIMRNNLSNEMYQNAIEKHPEMCIGAYYNQAMNSIINKYHDYQLLVYENLTTLNNICIQYSFQYNECIKMFQEIHKEDNNFSEFFVQQLKDKLKIMSYILKNIRVILTEINSKPNFKSYNKNDSFEKRSRVFRSFQIDIVRYKYINEIEKDIGVSQNVIEYFKDFGIDTLFEINCIEENCLIF